MENELLREQLLLLSLEKESLIVQGMENKTLREMLQLNNENDINLLPAKVTNMGIAGNLTSLTINVGTDDGVNRNDPILTPSGVIGKIFSVSKNTSIVQLISDSEFRIGIRFIPSGETGILRWKSNHNCEVREVYKNANIKVGDRVVTSGLSDIFPDNLPVGKVTSVSNDRAQFQKIVSVKIDENLNALRYVFVIVDSD
jgi:rod shape-determining protein MreC